MDESAARDQYRLTRASLLRALERGYTVEQVVALLAGGGDELTPAVLHHLYTWAETHRQVVIRRATILEVRDPAVLRDLSRVRRIRDTFTGTLSDRAVTVRADKLPLLVRQLERRGLVPGVDVPEPTVASPAAGAPPVGKADAAAIVAALRLASELSHELGRRLHIPHPLLRDWQDALTDTERDAVDGWLDDLLRTWRARTDQVVDEFQPPFPVQDTLSLLERAIAARSTVAIVYHTPRQPRPPAPRRVDPLRLEQLGRLGTWYLVAFCHSRGENRTFRLDRIAEVRRGEASGGSQSAAARRNGQHHHGE